METKLLTNKEYLIYSKNNPEGMFDKYYTKSVLVIPPTKSEKNKLTNANERLIDLITAFQVMLSHQCKKNDKELKNIIDEIIKILDNIKLINYSAFCQFFMVYNQTYDGYKGLGEKEKEKFIYKMLIKYCNERHKMYSSHGYSNTILQVISDNYSHKRKSKAGINKYVDILGEYIVLKLKNKDDLLTTNDYYFTPDKGGKKLFEYMLKELKIEMKSRGIENNKLPDLVFKHNDNYFICELKSMKLGGGGQDKQAVEFGQFINYSEDDKRIHYVTILDAEYSNRLFTSTTPKIKTQLQQVNNALKNNPHNYFLNTEGTKKFLQDLFSD